MNTSLRFACLGFVVGAVLAGIGSSAAWTVHASQAPPSDARRCDLTYIMDAGPPNIGEEGEIKYGANWKKLIDDGWVLKSSAGLSANVVYIFEKCR